MASRFLTECFKDKFNFKRQLPTEPGGWLEGRTGGGCQPPGGLFPGGGQICALGYLSLAEKTCLLPRVSQLSVWGAGRASHARLWGWDLVGAPGISKRPRSRVGAFSPPHFRALADCRPIGLRGDPTGFFGTPVQKYFGLVVSRSM